MTRIVLALLAAFALARGAAAQETASASTGAEASTAASAPSTAAPEAAALIYSVNRTPERTFDTARAAQVITAEEIWRRGARTLPEVLMEEPGLFIQQTDYGAGSPIVRGLIGKQILILMNGVKVNTATYRFGALQYLATIDLEMVERIEIVRGVGSVLGSDALGGVINVITKKGPPVAGDRLGAALSSRYSSADHGVVGRAEAYGQGEKYRFLGGATYRYADDVMGGQGVARQKASGYDEWAGNLQFEYFLSPDRTLSFGYQDLEQDDVPRTDRIATGSNLVYSFDPQRLQLLTAGYQDLTDRKWSDSFLVTAFWNRQIEGKQEVLTRSPSRQTNSYDRSDVFGFNVEVGVFPGGSHHIVYGVDYSHEKIKSAAEEINLLTQVATPRRGTWTDGATYEALGVYAQDRMNLSRWLTLTLGGRYGRFVTAGSEDSTFGELDLASTMSDLTGSASAVVHATSALNLVGRVTSGYRPPNLDDVSVFASRGSEGVEIPATEAEPERVFTWEAGLKLATGSLEGSAFYYDCSLTDLLARAPSTYNGLPFFDVNGNGSREPSEPLVLRKENIGEARVSGVELDARWRFHRGFTLFGNYTYTKGDDQTAGVPLSRIPPSFGTMGLRWSGGFKLQPWAEVVYQFAGDQRRLNPADISDVRIGPAGTDGFDTVHVRGGITVADLRLRAALENLTDEKYKYHGSGVYRPGRQLVLGAAFRF